MSFAENLKQIRKERDISQEELAELLTASRQAVSKWEQGAGYPEMEKMILLSEKLNVSLDELVFGQRKSGAPSQPVQPSGRIMIKSADGKQIVNCRKVLPSPVFRRKRKNVPQCALYGVDNVSSLWGENKVILGWYADVESLQKEMDAIWSAIRSGESFYDLKYAAKVRRKFLGLELEKSSAEWTYPVDRLISEEGPKIHFTIFRRYTWRAPNRRAAPAPLKTFCRPGSSCQTLPGSSSQCQACSGLRSPPARKGTASLAEIVP